MKIALGADGAGKPLLDVIAAHLKTRNDLVVTDLSEPGYYADTADRVASSIVAGQHERAILFCGTGIGVCISANKVPGIRAAVAWTAETAQLARLHNDANVLSLGARMYSADDAIAFTKVFVETGFSGAVRHARRLTEIAEYEKSGEIPLLPNGS